MFEPVRFVLCVDDDVDDLELVCQTIGEIDPTLKVVHAANGVEALSFLSKAKETKALPCLVILDINMPRMDGKQTLAEIKKEGELREVPVVVFSTSNNPIDRKYFASYNVELVTKPSNMRTMQQEVRRLLQHYIEG